MPFFSMKKSNSIDFVRKKVGKCKKTPFWKGKKSGFQNRRKKVRKIRPRFMEEKHGFLCVFF